MGRRAYLQVTVPRFILEGEPNCSTVDPEIFYAEEVYVPGKSNPINVKYAHEREAKAVCFECPLISKCLEFALDNYEMGIWGGTNESDRKRIRTTIGKANRSRRTRSYL